MEIIKQMLITDPIRRLSATELLQNKILQLRGQDYTLRIQYSISKQN